MSHPPPFCRLPVFPMELSGRKLPIWCRIFRRDQGGKSKAMLCIVKIFRRWYRRKRQAKWKGFRLTTPMVGKTAGTFSNPWKNPPGSRPFFPIVGKTFRTFSNHWKNQLERLFMPYPSTGRPIFPADLLPPHLYKSGGNRTLAGLSRLRGFLCQKFRNFRKLRNFKVQRGPPLTSEFSPPGG